MMDDQAPISPVLAATLVVFRERDGRPPELLVVERSAKMVFAGGAVVFPGGRVDPDDHKLGKTFNLDGEEAAARIAAIRETLEESGIAIGFTGVTDDAWSATARARLHAGELLSAILADSGVKLDLKALIPFARWCPPRGEARTFDTRFYLARAPDDAPDPQVDTTENVSSFWASAQAVIDAADEGRINIIFPTRRNLERLARFACFDDACAHAASYPDETIVPQIVEREGIKYLTIPAHLGYPVVEETLATAKRGSGLIKR